MTPDPVPDPGRPLGERLLLGLLVLQGVTAVGGGATMIAAALRDETGWFPAEWLEEIPFDSMLGPGLILGGGLGLSALVLAWGVLRRPRWGPLAAATRWTGHHWSWLGCLGLGTGLMAWIVVQRLLIPGTTWLQPLYLVIGAVIVGLVSGRTMRRRLALPPTPPR